MRSLPALVRPVADNVNLRRHGGHRDREYATGHPSVHAASALYGWAGSKV